MLIAILGPGCQFRQDDYATYYTNKACYFVGLETQTDELYGAAGSWYTDRSSCDLSDLRRIATYVQVDMTIQYSIPGYGWGSCHYMKSTNSSAGSTSVESPDYAPAIFTSCRQEPSMKPTAGMLFATNAAHTVRINGTDRWTNQAVTERAPY